MTRLLCQVGLAGESGGLLQCQFLQRLLGLCQGRLHGLLIFSWSIGAFRVETVWRATSGCRRAHHAAVGKQDLEHCTSVAGLGSRQQMCV